MTKAPLTPESAAIHRQQTADDECHAKDVHRELVDQIVQTVVKVVRSVVGNTQQNCADGQDNKPTEQQQVEQSAERLAMNTFLRQRIFGKPPNPHTPVTLKTAALTFAPEPGASRDLPH